MNLAVSRECVCACVCACRRLWFRWATAGPPDVRFFWKHHKNRAPIAKYNLWKSRCKRLSGFGVHKNQTHTQNQWRGFLLLKIYNLSDESLRLLLCILVSCALFNAKKCALFLFAIQKPYNFKYMDKLKLEWP